MWKKIKPYVIGIGSALLTGGISQAATYKNMDIYKDISLPPLSPPSWLFPIVWTILFILMGISCAIVYKRDKRRLYIYALQLFVNFLWTVIFFNFRAFLFSSVWLAFLIALICVMIKSFYTVDKKAGLLLLPYLIWVLFALYLNIGVYVLNR